MTTSIQAFSQEVIYQDNRSLSFAEDQIQLQTSREIRDYKRSKHLNEVIDSMVIFNEYAKAIFEALNKRGVPISQDGHLKTILLKHNGEHDPVKDDSIHIQCTLSQDICEFKFSAGSKTFLSYLKGIGNLENILVERDNATIEDVLTEAHRYRNNLSTTNILYNSDKKLIYLNHGMAKLFNEAGLCTDYSENNARDVTGRPGGSPNSSCYFVLEQQ